VIGSPGQAAYVAANAFLEGFARRRRQSGKPGLAIGWGAISDVGLIARDRKLGERLQRSTGVVGVRAAEALAHLGRLLALGDAVEPLQFYTMIAPGPAAAKLALLKSPAYVALGLWRDSGETENLDDLDVAIKARSRAQAHAILIKALRREAAQILRMVEDQIDPYRPLSESGFDSLMLLELVVSVERLTGLQLRVVGGGERTLASFATDIVNELIGTADGAPAEGAVELPNDAPQTAMRG
jgi:acyl carrier protein